MNYTDYTDGGVQVPRYLPAPLSPLTVLHREGQENHSSDLVCKLCLCHTLGNVYQGNSRVLRTTVPISVCILTTLQPPLTQPLFL